MREGPRRKKQETLYQVLQVSPRADPQVIHASYRALARRYHPDLNAGPQANTRMRELNAAYDVLGDDEWRAEYDAEQARTRRQSPVRRPPMSSTRATATTSVWAVAHESQLGATSARIRFALIVAILFASLTVALWLLVEAVTDTAWSVFLS